MNEFKKARGLAVGSGILFIVHMISANIGFIVYIGELEILDILLNLAFCIIPAIVLGIMLMIGKMHYGFIVPPILMIVQNIYNVIYRIKVDHFYLIDLISALVLSIPWIILIIVFIMCNKKGEKSPALKILCFIPTIVFVLIFIVSLIGITKFSVNYYSYGIGWTIISTVALIAALVLCGVWILTNTDPEIIYAASGQNKLYPQQSTGQPYYPQQGGYQQPYAPNYNQQSVNYQQGMAQPYGQPQYNRKQYQQQPYNQPAYQQSAEPKPAMGSTNEIEMLKAYRELLDNGTITQEEFDQKKKQILGL